MNNELSIKQLITILISFIIICSSCKSFNTCYSKDAFLDQLAENVQVVKKNGEKFTDAEWEEMDSKMDKLLNDCYDKFENDLTDSETKDVIVQAATYAYVRQKGNFEDFVEMMKKLELDERAEKFLYLADESLKDFFDKELKEDLEKVVDNALDEFENLAKDLKEAWEEQKDKN